MAFPRLNLPNTITIARILACPVLFALLLSTRTIHLFAAFLLFLAAALSDLWDGYLARRDGLITDTGKFLDPLADKLLLATTFLPFYIVSHRPDPFWELPWWGPLPLWVILVIFGRELIVTFFRSWAASRGLFLSAGGSGKVKAFIQNTFSGALILWYALLSVATERGWIGGTPWTLWSGFHGAFVAVSLAVAIFLTLYSLGIYYRDNRGLFRSASRGQ